MLWKIWKDDPGVRSMIVAGKGKDPATLALQWSGRKDIPVPWILQQIAGRNIASKKIPSWAENDAVIFPPKITLEQCSSQLTANYKAGSFKPYKRVADLTGGLGVDAWAFAQHAEQVLYVEPVEERFELAQHNHKALGASNISWLHTSAEDALEKIKAFKPDLIYMDPSRRDDDQKRVFRLGDLSPDPLFLKKKLLAPGVRILLKAAPMLDPVQALRELNHVSEVHVVSMKNECRELLFLLNHDAVNNADFICTELNDNIKTTFRFNPADERSLPVTTGEISNYLYDPFACVSKAGAFKSVADRFQLNALHANTHVYSSGELINDFPGRKFKVDEVMTYDPAALKKQLKNIKAHLVFRNFTDDADTVTKKLNVTSGGNKYIFFVTQKDNKPVVVSTTLIHS